MMFKNLTDMPMKVLDIIPDLISHDPNPKVKEELDEKEINFQVRRDGDYNTWLLTYSDTLEDSQKCNP